jgi:hypothetical protein
MVHVAESFLSAESHARLPGSELWPAPLQSDNGKFLPRRGRRTGGTSDALNRSVKPAELAQARIFKSTLQDELARLDELASRLGGPSGNVVVSASCREHRELGHIYAAIDEVRRLLEGLRGRFGMAD